MNRFAFRIALSAAREDQAPGDTLSSRLLTGLFGSVDKGRFQDLLNGLNFLTGDALGMLTDDDPPALAAAGVFGGVVDYDGVTVVVDYDDNSVLKLKMGTGQCTAEMRYDDYLPTSGIGGIDGGRGVTVGSMEPQSAHQAMCLTLCAMLVQSAAWTYPVEILQEDRTWQKTTLAEAVKGLISL
jgi:hypothetical protein